MWNKQKNWPLEELSVKAHACRLYTTNLRFRSSRSQGAQNVVLTTEHSNFWMEPQISGFAISDTNKKMPQNSGGQRKMVQAEKGRQGAEYVDLTHNSAETLLQKSRSIKCRPYH